MFHLWSLTEQDLLSDSVSYRLRDTGQGLNRVQAAPKTSRMMHGILHRAQKSLGSWVGSAAVHMGDHNVPNALMFIGIEFPMSSILLHITDYDIFYADKYSQVYRILLPVCNTLGKLPNIYSTPSLRNYIDSEFGSLDGLYLEILGDFFRHAFDGSGADNFYDAGSCIDGRLTSAWNWCAMLEKKRYFPVFLLTGICLYLLLRVSLTLTKLSLGFVGFDGEW
jgi:Protein of unknown function (DUF2009)